MKLFRESCFAPNFALPAQPYASIPATSTLPLPATILPPVPPLGRRTIRINDVAFRRIPHEADVPWPLPPLAPPHEAEVPLPLRLLHLIPQLPPAALHRIFHSRHHLALSVASICRRMRFNETGTALGLGSLCQLYARRDTYI